MEVDKRKRIRGGYRKKAVADIRESIRVGDLLEFKFIYLETGKRVRTFRKNKGQVKTKYPHIMEVEMSGGAGSRKTVQYTEVLTGEVEWEGRRKYHASDYRI